MARTKELHFKDGSVLTALSNGRLSIYETLYKGDEIGDSDPLLNIDPVLTVADILPSKVLTPEETIIAKEDSQAITKALALAIDRLPQKEAAAFTLITVEGYSHKEAAFAMGGIPEGKAKYLNKSAIQKLSSDAGLIADLGIE